MAESDLPTQEALEVKENEKDQKDNEVENGTIVQTDLQEEQTDKTQLQEQENPVQVNEPILESNEEQSSTPNANPNTEVDDNTKEPVPSVENIHQIENLDNTKPDNLEAPLIEEAIELSQVNNEPAVKVDPLRESNATIAEKEIVSLTIPKSHDISNSPSSKTSYIGGNIVTGDQNVNASSPSMQLTTVSTTIYANQERHRYGGGSSTLQQSVSAQMRRAVMESPINYLQTESKESIELSKNPSAVHYLTPISQMSHRSVNEGDIIDDYMRFIIEPIEKESIVDLSSESSTDISCVEAQLQRTIAIIKPDAVIYKDVILRTIQENGFQIIGMRFLHLTPEQVSEIYAKHYGSPSFPYLVVTTSSGPVLVLSLAAVNAINKWKNIIGPNNSLKEEWFYPLSVRTRFGIKETRAEALHASENQKESNLENRYFYPENILEPLTADLPKVTDYCSVYVLPALVKGLVEVVKKKPNDPIKFLADWLLINNPYQPRLPHDIAITPT